MNRFLFGIFPYLCLAVFVVGHYWRYTYDKFGWTTRSSQLYEDRLLRIGSPLFHFGMLGVVGGHVLGLLIPQSWTDKVGLSREAYHVLALVGGIPAGVMAVVVTDKAGNFVEVNPAFTTMTGYTADDVLGRPVSILKSGRHPPEFYAAMWQGVKENNSWQGEVWNRRKDGEIFVVRLSITRVARIGQAVRYVATLTDITHSKELEEDLRHRAYHDPLTDLPNRALFTDRLRVAILQGERHGRGFALCFIDLDSFKPINDTLGHAAGDELLVETARRLRLGVRAAIMAYHIMISL